MRKILLTGASGLLGSRIQEELYQQGVDYVCLDRTHGYDLLNPVGYLPLFKTDNFGPVTHVIHAAANTSFGPNSKKVFEINYDATVQFAKLCLENLPSLERFTYVSTGWQCGLEPDRRHIIPYTQSKHFAEEELKRIGLPLTIVRPSILMDEQSTSIIWVFLLAYALGRFTFNINDVIDVVPASWAAEAIVNLTTLQEPLEYEFYNISSNYSQQTYRRIFEEFDKYFGQLGIAKDLDVFHSRYKKATNPELHVMIDSSDCSSKMKKILKYTIDTFGVIGAQNKVFNNKPLLKLNICDYPPPLVNYVDKILAFASKFSMEQMIEAETKE